jgi:hypothetical protein
LSFFDLKEKEQVEQKEVYGDRTEDSAFFRYKGSIYCFADFPRLGQGYLTEKGWHAAMATTFLTGIVIAVSDCGNFVKVGSYQ